MTLHEKAQKIKAIALDIDGVQTDGTIGFGAGSDEIKFFYARDGHGITMAKRAGIVFAVLSGRKAMCNRTRMEAMGFQVIMEGCLDKKEGFTELAQRLGMEKEEIGSQSLYGILEQKYGYKVKKSKEEIKQIAVDGAELLNKLASEVDGNFSFEYSPESFPGTEVDYAWEVCNAVLDVWKPKKENKVIINIPATVENAEKGISQSREAFADINLTARYLIANQRVVG